jgi:hypothetical protein
VNGTKIKAVWDGSRSLRFPLRPKESESEEELKYDSRTMARNEKRANEHSICASLFLVPPASGLKNSQLTCGEAQGI